jgi:uncharacterized protein
MSMPALYLHTPAVPTLPDLHGQPPRVVLDTAIVVSALLFGGPVAGRLRRAWRHGFCRPVVCRHTLLDLTRQLGQDRLGLSMVEQQQLLGEYMPHVLQVRTALPETADPVPAGLVFVQLAMAGQVHVLVTSDTSLLAMADRLPFAVLALEPFLHLLRATPIQPAPLRAPARSRR